LSLSKIALLKTSIEKPTDINLRRHKLLMSNKELTFEELKTEMSIVLKEFFVNINEDNFEEWKNTKFIPLLEQYKKLPTELKE